MSERLVMNHLVVIFNVFGNDAGLKMLEYRMDNVHWSVLKPFLVYLKIIPNDKYNSVKMDPKVVELLRNF